jgi:ubiquinone/menaquinone biosynthesis C-methylase UbiE
MHGTDTREKIAQGYSMKASEYDEIRLKDAHGALLSQHDIALVNNMLNPPRDVRLLELGAGTGRFTLPILERGYSILATDVNESLLEGLREKVARCAAAQRCEVRNESIFSLSFSDNSIDYAYSLHVIPRFLTLDEQAAAIKEVGRVLKPGGRFLFNFRNSKSPYNLIHRGHAASLAEIEQVLADSEMHIVDIRGKHFSNRRLYNVLPMFVNRLVSKIDNGLERVLPRYAWDVFILAEKQSPQDEPV